MRSLDLYPTLTNSIGAEGLFSTTYDNLQDTVSFDPTSKFFKPDTFIQVKPSQPMTSYYGDRDDGHLSGISGMGVKLYSDVDGLLDLIDRLDSDGRYWKDMLEQNIETVRSRSSGDLISKVLGYNLSNLIGNVHTMRKANNLHQEVWNEYIK